MSENDSVTVDLVSFLSPGRLRTEQLLEGYFATDSWAKRGGYAQLLIKELSNLLSIREEVLRPLLRELEAGAAHLHRLDEARGRQLDLLAQLDDLTKGVGPRDVHQHQPDRVIELIKQLRGAVHDYDAYEASDLLPFIEARLARDRLTELGQQASKASRRGPTHPHPSEPPADQRSILTKTATRLHDRLHDMAEHPEEAVESEGEQGP
jgi:hypothetical protein